MFVSFAVLLVAAAAQAAPWDHRIVGGHDAGEGAFPHQISLQYGLQLLHSHVCGGSILNERWILTAGHCITEVPHLPLNHYYVKAGINSLKGNGQVIRAKNTYVHPDYQGGVNPNDIALVELESDLKFNDKVKPVVLPTKDVIIDGQATLSGWGSMGGSIVPIMPDKLQTVDMPLIGYENCKQALIDLTGTSDPLKDTNVCTGPLEGGVSACSGDSGGPLIAKEGDKTVQVGIVSWGMMPCGSVGAPSVYTRVSAFVDFINEHVK